MTIAADFETLWHEYHEAVHTYVGKRVPQNVVDDLVQDVYLRAWSALLRGYGWHSNARAWLYRIARNLIVDTHRAAAREWPVELDDMRADVSYDGDNDWSKEDGHLVDAAPQPYEATVAHMQHEVVRWAVGRLTNEQERVLTLRLDGYAMEEVAAEVGKAVYATKALDYRARQSIAPLVRAKWGEAA